MTIKSMVLLFDNYLLEEYSNAKWKGKRELVKKIIEAAKDEEELEIVRGVNVRSEYYAKLLGKLEKKAKKIPELKDYTTPLRNHKNSNPPIISERDPKLKKERRIFLQPVKYS